ncbi:transglutaminase TgpA family protein [Bacillus sp. FJAT-27245]|uniref:transglutaminase TgpA family protein n=1 Tax=Bacillus sp. FJAT-27245 TaxID=1684144 RepID=UPI0006A7E609|nr:transglutaminaseTgpA domain-containing protein [Bacillus sp. FJAT-27245]
MNDKKDKLDLSALLLYGFGFLLIWEWLRPLDELTDTDNIEVFIIFLVIAFASSIFHLGKMLQFFIKSFYILYAIYRFYFEGGFFSAGWLGNLIADLKMNVGLLLSQDYQQLTNVFRTILFFILLWLMVYLIQYWLLNRRRIFVFFLMTIIYITVLDTFTTYKGDGAIVRTVIAGFSVMGMLTFFRLFGSESSGEGKRHVRKWAVALSGMIAFSTAAGFAAPKAAPIWPDPVPFLKSLNENAGGGTGGVSRIGYGTNDSRLGGPFLPDNTIVFRADAESRHYWRVETKDVYTGKGWILSELVNGGIGFTYDDPVPLEGYPESVKKKEYNSRVYMYLKYPHLVYPLGIKKIMARGQVTFRLNTATEKIQAMEPWNKPAQLDNYSFIYDEPAFKLEELRWADGSDNGGVEEEFIIRYTQLPETLPSRVKELANEIAGEKTNWYDKARAIENYFDRSEFTYDQKNVAVPRNDEDYVDQFLFDTKTGYCDNFSTSMVVMLRSLGIPARWVKGYTYGELKSFGDGELKNKLYEVTNNNAHSWVEVFFPNLGWIPFEPTKGFSNNIHIDYETTTNPSNNPVSPGSSQNDPNRPDRLNKLEDNDPIPKQVKAKTNVLKEIKLFFKKEWKKLAAGTAALIAAIWFAYSNRGRWLPYYLIYRYKLTQNDEQFGKAYLSLLKQLQRYGLPRQDGQTLRNYASYVDSFFTTREMGKLTSKYEHFLYRREMPEGTWKETRQLWENLIKKTIS